jgi:hypothetical protein
VLSQIAPVSGAGFCYSQNGKFTLNGENRQFPFGGASGAEFALETPANQSGSPGFVAL